MPDRAETRNPVSLEPAGGSTALRSILFIILVSNAHAMSIQAFIDDRSTATLEASRGGAWRLITDQVMGGTSNGELKPDRYRGRHCLHLSGSVSTANNGGFIQMALDLAGGKPFDASQYAGLLLQVAGNSERYNLHLRTGDLWLPWQSYRFSFAAEPEWREIRIPFAELRPYRTNRRFSAERLIRLGLVAIGREFAPDLCAGSVRFYTGDTGPQRSASEFND